MSMDYVITIKLATSLNEKAIEKILQRGSEKDFIYYDHKFGELYKTAPIINATQATLKILKAIQNNVEEGPAVFTSIDISSDVHLWFYKSNDEYLLFQIGAFGCPQKKGYYIDFAYYIRMFLDLCEDFVILELKTDVF